MELDLAGVRNCIDLSMYHTEAVNCEAKERI